MTEPAGSKAGLSRLAPADQAGPSLRAPSGAATVSGRGPTASPEAAAILAKVGRENFPVASRLLPQRTRTHLMAIYGFARLVDDLGDDMPGDRMAWLDWLEGDLDRAFGGTPEHPLLRRLGATVRALDLPKEPFLKLIEANRQDQVVTTYPTYQDLAAYCELSANPVGRLVLFVLDAASPERIRLSDAVCTGLQLTEHWQDVKEDLSRGRIYLPQEDLARFGCAPSDLASSVPTEAFRRLMAFEVERARSLLDDGAAIVSTMRGRPRLAVAAFVAGGRSALGAISGADYDVLGRQPRPTTSTRLLELVKTLARTRERSKSEGGSYR